MQTALVKGKIVLAGSDSLELAICPPCKGMVVKRSRKRQDGGATYF